MLPATAFQELKIRLQGTPAATGIALERLVPTAVEPVDALLGGGLPAGSLVTLEGLGSCGRWSIAAALLAQATRRGLGAVIDDGELYPPALEAAGVRLDRLLVVPAHTPVGAARAADALLRSRTVRVLVMAAARLRAAVWSRLASLANRSGAVLVVIAARAAAELGAAAAVRLWCSFDRAIVHGTRGLWCTLDGFDARTELRKHKRAGIGAFAALRSVVPTGDYG
jgi:hypothetical protein